VATIEDVDGFERKYPINRLVKEGQIDAYRIGNAIKDKEIEITKKIISATMPSVPSAKRIVVEVDLHIEVLLEEHRGLSNFDIVQVQMRTCRAAVQNAIHNHTKKLILIHGKGEGVLKSEIHYYLNQLSNTAGRHFVFHDASFTEYGHGGATEVLFS
jgi:hypothetical protein